MNNYGYFSLIFLIIFGVNHCKKLLIFVYCMEKIQKKTNEKNGETETDHTHAWRVEEREKEEGMREK